MKTFYGIDKNVGDTLTPVILEALTDHKAEYVEDSYEGKLLMVGSLLEFARPGDTVLGTGYNKEDEIDGTGIRFLAVRGPLTRAKIKNAEVPEVYGDPALLLPLIYKPKVKKEHRIGIVPHYFDKPFTKELARRAGEKYIDIESDWKTVVNEIVSCEKIISSSLHGVIIAEAYGIPVQWQQFDDRVQGAQFKYDDYKAGATDIKATQKGLLNALKQL